ncbi:MAG: hypothetical protein QOG83_782, partial [Alphaproteobacteria bacterium]|nr:hypothetical protein [Alphaproteobacteria bacterium]
VYASFNLSLCILESYVQLPIPLRINLPELAAVRIEIPDLPIRNIELEDLKGERVAQRCRELGDAWLAAEEQLVLTAPSFIVPQERNVMINPAHPMMRLVKIVLTSPFRFDPRLALARD